MSGIDASPDPGRDERLMAAARDGDLASLGELYRIHFRKVHALCYRMTGSGELADDLVQETFVRILRHRGSFRSEGRFTTWMYRIARNVCVDHLQRARRRERFKRALGESAPTGTAPEARSTGRHDSLPDPSLVERALARMAPEKREALILSRYHDLRHAEVGEILGCSAGAARVRVHRAMKELRSRIQRLENESDEV